ncbi:fibronectin type III domain-containing protein [Telmatobacter sp. DSM 110680]|uniref:Fibronectin type III domain-containing protein n=1 Tax=Telmatobacter sp. DSM 110680 TaxID=3036704 RepID=A0AAU7DED7_9BACT
MSTTQSATLTATADGVSQTEVFQLDGSGPTGSVQHHVQLSWNAPSSTPVALAGYRVYRMQAGGSSYQLLNSSIDVNTSYTDTAVQSGQTYDYVVKSVDDAGVESNPSNITSVTIP